MSSTDPITEALKRPNGARFYRCALQVNPFDYLVRHKKNTGFASEAEYNEAMTAACSRLGIEVVAITDHYRIQSAVTLRDALNAAGIVVFPGFEAKSKEGVHVLCLFGPDSETVKIERFIGDCGVHDHDDASPTGNYDFHEILEKARKSWNAVCIAAHVAADGGLLSVLKGEAAIRAWTCENLLACSIAGPVSDAPDGIRPMLQNKNQEYRREHSIAILNAQDVSSPADLEKPSASCFVKMSNVSIDGLQQAFLDPGSRIRLNSDDKPGEHAEFLAMAWDGGFLDGTLIHFNQNLNVLIGGRGTGKSTIVESLRYVLDLEPLGDDAKKGHDGIVRKVLKSGTKISLLVRSHRPAMRTYRIERTIPNAPVVRDESGQVLKLLPADVLPMVEVYSQHEISELSKSKERLTRLLARFVEKDDSIIRRKKDLLRDLKRSRTRIVEATRESSQIDERLSTLPSLEETLARFQEAGLEDRLKEQSLLVREERVLKTARERIEPTQEAISALQESIPIDRAFLSTKALAGLPGKAILTEADQVLTVLGETFKKVIADAHSAMQQANKGMSHVGTKLEERHKKVQAEYGRILRELQKSQVDGEEFIRLRREIEELRPLRERQALLKHSQGEYESERRNLLAEWEDLKAQEFRLLGRAARRVTKKLADRVEVIVAFAGNRESLFELLRERVGGQLSKTAETIRSKSEFSLGDFANACRAGAKKLQAKYSLTPTQAKNIAEAKPEIFMMIEELDLSPTTLVKLNVAAAGETPTWKALDDLSAGQKATAVLLLLLLESEAPLVVDQPEDDLDNRFITDGVVPKMRDEKRHRQFVFATHNANIPVLGDAELILGLSASGEGGGQGKARIPSEHMGSIDGSSVRELVEELLEGGRTAFEMRRLKYGF